MILIIESDLSIQRLLSVNLQARGHKVETVRSVDDALDVLAQAQPLVIILGVWLPGADGYDRLDALRLIPTFGDLKLILMSSFTINHAFPPQVIRVIEMPVDIAEVVDAVNLALS